MSERRAGSSDRAGLFVARYALFAFIIAALFAVPVRSDPIFDSAHALFAGVLRAASFGMTDLERAAFIVRDADGSLHLEDWPATDASHAETFRGEMPPGTIAIVHTHPVGWPRPSTHDIAEARRLGLPIYVLTMRNVFCALPDSSWPKAVVRDRTWFKEPAAPLSARIDGERPVEEEGRGNR